MNALSTKLNCGKFAACKDVYISKPQCYVLAQRRIEKHASYDGTPIYTEIVEFDDVPVQSKEVSPPHVNSLQVLRRPPSSRWTLVSIMAIHADHNLRIVHYSY